MEKSIQDLVLKQVELINAHKEFIVKKRLKEYLGYDLDIKKESQRTFPRLMKQIHPDGLEIYVWNDGTESGHKLVTFKPKNPNPVINGFTASYVFEYEII